MCGRFAFYSPREAVTRLFGVEFPLELEPRYAPARNNLGVAFFHAGQNEDAIDAFLRLAQVAGEPAIAGQAFNIGTGAPRSELEMTEHILRAMDREDLQPEVRPASPHAIVHQSLATDKLCAATGWTATRELEDGLARTVAWYRDYL